MTSLTSLSLGAGVQSTTLALLAVEGVLPQPDIAIFADTGWEPRAVYEHLDRLQPVMEAAGIEVHRVTQGNLRDDALNPHSRFTTIPYFILNPEFEVPVLVPCPACGGKGERSTMVHAGDDPDGPLVPAAYECTTCGGSGDQQTGTRPAKHSERLGMGRRQCTSEYKLKPIRRLIREMLGATPPDFKRVPAGNVCEQWVGFSTDEVHRANRRKDSDGVRYLTTRYPLLDLGMSRTDCERWLAARGWSATKSACIGCPFHGNRQWRDLRDNHPDEWADAVDFDNGIRKGARGGRADLSLQGEAFLHRSRLPLDQAPIDRVTSVEWGDRQGSLLDVIADEAEDGDVDGCSPYGCRSGEDETA